LAEQQHLSEIEPLGFEERLGLLADREITEREDRRLKTRLRQARLKHHACLEDLDYRAPRGLDKSLMASLATCRWIHEGLNLIVHGPTGVGKTWIACALAQKACREGYTAQYLRLQRCFEDLHLAHGDGRNA
jgi:DNA replication protein DnaC